MARCPILTKFYWCACIIVCLYSIAFLRPLCSCTHKCDVKFRFRCSTRRVRFSGRNERWARDGTATHLINHLILLLCRLTFHLFRFISCITAPFSKRRREGKKSEQPVDVHLWGPGRQRRHRGGCTLSGGGVSLTAALKLFLHQVFELRLRAHIAGLQPADYRHSRTLCLFVFTLSALSEPERAGLFYNRPSCRINLCHGDSPWATASTHCLWQRTERPHGQEGRTGQLPHCGAFSVTWKYRRCVCATWCATYSAFGVHSLTQSLTQSSTLVWTHAAFTFTSVALWHTNTRQRWKVLRGLSYSQLRMGQFRCVLGCSGKRRSNLSIRLGESSQRKFQAQSQS